METYTGVLFGTVYAQTYLSDTQGPCTCRR